MDWVPYFVVVGDDEVASKKLTMTVRKKSQPNKPFKEQMTVEALIAAVRKDVEGKPLRPLYTPCKLSMKARYKFLKNFKKISSDPFPGYRKDSMLSSLSRLRYHRRAGGQHAPFITYEPRVNFSMRSCNVSET